MNALEILLVCLALSILASGILAVACSLIERFRPLRAGIRQWIWFAALIAIALLPVAGITSAMVRSHSVTIDRGSSPHRTGTVLILSTTPPAPIGNHTSVAMPNQADRTPVQRWKELLLSLLAAGVLAGFFNIGFSLVRLRAIKRRSTPLSEELSHELSWLAQTTHGRETYLRLSYEIETPMAIGFGRPVILVPTDLANENGLAAIESLVIHEHAHLRHYDDYTNLVQRFIERLNWFNPFVWYIGRRLTLAREMAADDAVLERGNDRADYAQTLWRMAREMRMPTQPIVAPGAFFTRKQISQRIEAILAANRGQLSPLDPTAVAIGATLAFIAYGAVVLLTPAYQFQSIEIAESAHSGDASTELPPLPAPPHLSVPFEAGIPTIPPSALGYVHKSAIIERIISENRMQQHTPLPPVPARPKAPSLATHCKSGCDLSGQDFSGKDLSNQSFSGSDLSNANFRGATLHNTRFGGANLDGAEFVGADLSGAHFSGASIDNADFTGAKMDGVSFNGIVLTSATFDNAGLRSILTHGCSGCDLSGRTMRGIDLSGVNLSGANLSGVDLRGANLRHAFFSGIDFDGANLDQADLSDATFSGCSLSGVTTKNTKMERVTLQGSSFN